MLAFALSLYQFPVIDPSELCSLTPALWTVVLCEKTCFYCSATAARRKCRVKILLYIVYYIIYSEENEDNVICSVCTAFYCHWQWSHPEFNILYKLSNSTFFLLLCGKNLSFRGNLHNKMNLTTRLSTIETNKLVRKV